MSFSIMHLDGAEEVDPDPPAFAELLAELADAGDEQPDVAVRHESEWSLSALANGAITCENVAGNDPPRHLTNLTSADIVALFETLARGDIAAVEALPWIPGYPGSVAPASER